MRISDWSSDVCSSDLHALGLKVTTDLVFAHTSDRHAWFAESRASRDNDKADWYVWADAKPDGSPPTNWQSVFGGPAWTWDARRGQYYMHNRSEEHTSELQSIMCISYAASCLTHKTTNDRHF